MFVVAVLMGVSAKMVMNSLNKKMGLETEESVSTSDTPVNEENMEAVVMPEFTSAPVLETGSSAWAPEWKTTPCSIFCIREFRRNTRLSSGITGYGFQEY